MKLWNAILAIAPATVFAWFNAWLAPLHGTGIAHPKWEESANSLSAIFATVLVLILFVVSQYVGRITNIVIFIILAICHSLVPFGFMKWLETRSPQLKR